MWTKATNPETGETEFIGEMSLVHTLPDGRSLSSLSWAEHKSESKTEFITATEESTCYTLFNDVDNLEEENV